MAAGVKGGGGVSEMGGKLHKGVVITHTYRDMDMYNPAYKDLYIRNQSAIIEGG